MSASPAVFRLKVRHYAGSGRLVVSAEVTGAFMTEDGRPARIPEAFRERLSALL